VKNAINESPEDMDADVAKDDVMPKGSWPGNIHRSAGVILIKLVPYPHHPRVGNL
jgi:hypothetical protein